MNKILFLITLLITTQQSFGQIDEYSELANRADSLYNAKDYRNCALTYSNAFKSNGWKGSSSDRYNAACCWALSNNADSSFFQLFKIVTKGGFKEYQHASNDSDLISLHDDRRWKEFLNLVRNNKEKAEVNLNKPLAAQLDSIYEDDQKYRQELEGIEKKHGGDSKEMRAHWKIIQEKDSINLIKVKNILDEVGWLGFDVLGDQGNSALFLVIQHSDIVTQEKYLPMMRDAVKKGNAHGSQLALLEDRVALRQGKKQIYGSQIGKDNETNKYYVSPLEDPDNVDKRRAEVGLGPLATYVSQWQIKWDVKQYKKDLPKLEEIEKRMNRE